MYLIDADQVIDYLDGDDEVVKRENGSSAKETTHPEKSNCCPMLFATASR